MKTKLIKATVRRSGHPVYFGRCYRPSIRRQTFDNVSVITCSNGCVPAAIALRQRYMKVSELDF